MKKPILNFTVFLSAFIFSSVAYSSGQSSDHSSKKLSAFNFGDSGISASAHGFTAEHAQHDDSCYPKGEVRPELMGFAATGISKDQFEGILTKVDKVYQPEFKKMGWRLDMVNLWEDDQTNAAAMPHPKNPNLRGVLMYGGMARHPMMTVDAFTMIACHEVGHHIGGAPKTTERKWGASNEGQSDYFASLKCARKVFGVDNNVAIMGQMRVPKEAKAKCFAKFRANEDRAICLRTVMAGRQLGKVLNALTEEGINTAIANVVKQCKERFSSQVAQCIQVNLTLRMGMPKHIVSTILADVEKGQLRRLQLPTPDIDTPDQGVVEATDHSHPQAQCRVDTMYQGALCPVGTDVAVKQDDVEEGTCVRRTGDSEGVRPFCWYSPSDPDNNKQPSFFNLPFIIVQR